jgi:hypothetical protein
MLQTDKPVEFDNSYNKSEISLIISMKIVNLKVIQSVLLKHLNNKAINPHILSAEHNLCSTVKTQLHLHVSSFKKPLSSGV